MTDIVFDGVSKSFGEEKVIDNLSVVFEEGKRYAVMGPSGSGKTTVLKIIAGVEGYDSGKVLGVPDKISFVFQEDRLCSDFNAVSNIKLVLDKNITKESIVENLTEIGLGDDYKKPVRKLSGGMKRRVAIARAMMYGGDLVLMDEPFKGLDEKLRREVMDYTKKYTEGKTVIFVTHDREEAEYMNAEIINLTK